jgi:lipopolysaccharide/colanic/teichoic acid biosynthesis glycosyltransferase
VSAAAVPDFSRETDTVLIVGINRLTNLYVRSIDDLGAGLVRIAGILSSQRSYQGRSIGPHKVLGQPSEASEVIKQLGVHGVFVSRLVVMVPPEDLSASERQKLEQAAAKHDVPLQYFSEMLGFAPAAPRDMPALGTGSPAKAAENRDTLWRHANRPYWMVKRVVDFALASVLLLLLSPVFALVALIVAFDVGLPIIFWQQRPGARGQPFAIYKFRTMGASHDSRGRRLADEQRISAIGNFLRSTRLDELPQLLNVLRGNMSFIGPRPLLPVDQFPGLEARLAIPPGITGWAQVNGGREVSAADKAAMDIWYLKHASVSVDLTICVKTIEMILFGERTNEAAIDAAWDELHPPVRSIGGNGVETTYTRPPLSRLRDVRPR